MSKQSFIQTYLTESERAIFYPKQIFDENGLCMCESCLDCNSSRFRNMKKPRQCVCCQCYNLRDIKIENDKMYCLDCYGAGLDEINIDDYICEICGEVEYDEVGLATGENGVEMRVCRFCDVDGSNYNGWGDKDNRECCEMCNNKTSRDEWTDYLGNDILYCDDCYEAHRVRIEQKCTGCNFRQSSPDANLCSMCEPVCHTCGDDLDSNDLIQGYHDESVYQCADCFDNDKEEDEELEDMTMEELCEYVSNMSGMDVSEGWEREDIIEMIREMK